MRISDWSSDVCSSDLPSIRLLATQYDPPKADLTVKVTGHQWYWTYEYPDAGDLAFDSVMLSDQDAAKRGDPDRKSVVEGKSVSVRVDLGGRGIIQQKNNTNTR